MDNSNIMNASDFPEHIIDDNDIQHNISQVKHLTIYKLMIKLQMTVNSVISIKKKNQIKKGGYEHKMIAMSSVSELNRIQVMITTSENPYNFLIIIYTSSAYNIAWTSRDNNNNNNNDDNIEHDDNNNNNRIIIKNILQRHHYFNLLKKLFFFNICVTECDQYRYCSIFENFIVWKDLDNNMTLEINCILWCVKLLDRHLKIFGIDTASCKIFFCKLLKNVEIQYRISTKGSSLTILHSQNMKATSSGQININSMNEKDEDLL
ncbi:hypothetical protein RFI_29966 [Reticulomyxa filosa]|uniref:Uncharacterized protein n=1 Tax=Reticulomyxa filosa TaxID=46433 RepID=X6M0Q2_RETFI|nr:hypothetical protein RFI_29966 [Reticulomyxa filosa]|eukprot:ETO07434.1 hypothetical protein RFI_29966 [Reticulomyxa filosa]